MKAYKPFDDSQQKDRRRATEDPSSDVSKYAPHRQGAENTLPSHYAAGITKIHDGYNDQTGEHGTVQLVLGQEKVGVTGAPAACNKWREGAGGSASNLALRIISGEDATLSDE